jgi:capsular exopolysaccharide synthesis family protein
MSEIYEALKQSERDALSHGIPKPGIPAPVHGDGGIAVAVQTIELPQPAAGELLRLNEIPELQVNRRIEKLVTLSGVGGLGAEKFQVLATRLSHMCKQHKLRVLHVTSAVTGEGKSLIASNLAVMLANRANARVLLIDGDLRRPNIARVLELEGLAGLGDWMEEGAGSIVPYLRRIHGLPLWFLPAGVTSEPAKVLESARLKEIITQLAEAFDWIVIDSPPMLPMADANLWSAIADGTLLVVRQGKTPRRALEHGLKGLDNAKIVGVVLNDAAELGSRSYYSHYYRQYHEQQSE